MWRWSSAGVGWSRPQAAASRSAPPASARAGWARFDRGPAHDRRVPRLSRLGAADRGRAGMRAGWRLSGAGGLAPGPDPLGGPEAAMILALWLLSLPFLILACLFLLAVTCYGVAQDLGLLEPPAQAAPARKKPAGQPRPTRVAVADI